MVGGVKMELNEMIGERINNLCKENNLSINRLASICGLRQSTISNILNGNSKNPTINSIKKICNGLGISLATFFDDPIFDFVD